MIKDKITVLETNIDDLSPLNYELLFEKLFNAGALDVYLTPVQMKKSRPGVLLTVLAKARFRDKLTAIIFDQTSTFGIRFHQVTRYKLERKTKKVNTSYGRIRVKVGSLNRRVKTVSPEYEDCKRLAREKNVSLRRVFQEARQACEEIER